MKKYLLFLIYLFAIPVNVWAQNDSFPYVLDQVRPIGAGEGYLLPGNKYQFTRGVNNYTPEAYPGLFSDTDTALQQQWMHKSGTVSIQTDTDFNVLHIQPLFLHEDYPANTTTENQRYLVYDSDNQMLFYLRNKYIVKIDASDGSLVYVASSGTTDTTTLSHLAYHNHKLYGLTLQHVNDFETGIVPGKIYVYDAYTGALENQYIIGEPNLSLIYYPGLAVDDSGIYVHAILNNIQNPLGLTFNTDFYYTQGAFQPYIQSNFPYAYLVHALTKYELEQPDEMIWSTYLGGSGIAVTDGNSLAHNSLQLTNESLWLLGTIQSGTNMTTEGAYNTTTTSGFFLMRFTPDGSREMGTFVYNSTIGSHRYSFAQNTTNEDKAMVQTQVSSVQNINVSENAPLTEYQGGAYDVIISEFNAQGQRNFATYWGSPLNDRFNSVVNRTDGFDVFASFDNASLPNVPLTNYPFTDTTPLLDFQAEYNNNTRSAFVRFVKERPTDTETFQNDTFSVYPNPATIMLNIQTPESFVKGIATIYDSQGRFISKQNFSAENEKSVNVGSLSAGMYFLEIQSEPFPVQRIKFVKR